jgi:hypothetical protein
MYISLRSFQWYVTHPLHAFNLRRFLTFMIGNQINTLTIGLYLGHNLCCKYSNESCEFILNIYVSRDFQWYKELFNLNFDLSNHSLKIRKSLRIQISKMGAHLGMCGFIPSHFPTFSEVGMWLPGCILGLHLSMPFVLVANPRLGL